MQKFFYLYKITNNINGHFYYGVHTTNNLNDGYMGSGVRLHQAYKKYGIENFTKEILEYFNNSEDLFNREREIVNEDLIKDPNCYNIALGGSGTYYQNKISILGNNGELVLLDKDSERYKTGNYISYWANKTLCKNDDGSLYWISLDEFNPQINQGIRRGLTTVIDNEGNKLTILSKDYDRSKYKYVNHDKIIIKDENNTYKAISRKEWNSGNYEFMFKDTAIVTDENGNHFRMNINDPNYKKYSSIFKNRKLVKDKDGNKFWIDENDNRWKSGELVGITKGYKMHENTKNSLKNIKATKDKISIYNLITHENKFIFPNELSQYENYGWIKGMIQNNGNKIMINNGKIQQYIEKTEVESFISNNPEFCIGGLKKGKSGRIYVNKNGKNKHILLGDKIKYLENGWQLGRIMKDQTNNIHISNDDLNMHKFIDKKEAEEYLKNGWRKGMLKRKKNLK